MSTKSKKPNIWQDTKRPINVLSPMAGYTDSSFRMLCHELGADLVITELISADAIFHKAKNWKKIDGEWISVKGFDETLDMLKFAEAERPIIIQLFGKFPEKFAFAADWITKNLKPDGIDINMGCPARKVVGSDHGAALLKNPKLACEIVRAVKENTDLPVSVKTRLGWDSDDQVLEFAPKLKDAGIDALILHGRTYKDGFSGTARWENIYKAKELLGDTIVIGNGDLKNFSDLSSKLSNLDGAAIGRAVIGKPWVFSKESVSREELKKIIARHAQLSHESKGEYGLVEFRKHLLQYLKGFENAKELRLDAANVKSVDDVSQILDKIEQ